MTQYEKQVNFKSCVNKLFVFIEMLLIWLIHFASDQVKFNAELRMAI